MVAIQIGRSNANFFPPSGNSSQEKVKVVESYLKKELIVETIETPQPIKGNHTFAYGHCTSYVAKKRGGLPWSGNASKWLYNAPKYNYEVVDEPMVGAILVTNESGYGHVAYVESVGDNNFVVSEMNYSGFNQISFRTIAKNSKFIKGFIL